MLMKQLIWLFYFHFFQVLLAETKLVLLLVEDNITLTFADMSNWIFQELFDDSKIAKERMQGRKNESKMYLERGSTL